MPYPQATRAIMKPSVLISAGPQMTYVPYRQSPLLNRSFIPPILPIRLVASNGR